MHIPTDTQQGRLRLRFSQLKHQTEQLGSMAAAMRAIEGVLMVETIAQSGGFLIHYDALIGKTPAFWDGVEAVLLAHKLLLNPRPLARLQGPLPGAPGPPRQQALSVTAWPRVPARQIRSATLASSVTAGARQDSRLSGAPHQTEAAGRKLVRVLAKALMSRLIERSAIVLVAVLLA